MASTVETLVLFLKTFFLFQLYNFIDFPDIIFGFHMDWVFWFVDDLQPILCLATCSTRTGGWGHVWNTAIVSCVSPERLGGHIVINLSVHPSKITLFKHYYLQYHRISLANFFERNRLMNHTQSSHISNV